MNNIPNILTASRIVMVPFFVWQFMLSLETGDYVIPALILIISGITDVLDGYIARKFNMVSELGKVLDPLADKITVFAVCGCLWMVSFEHRMLLVFFVVKEIIVMSGAWVLISNGRKVSGSLWFGKLYTIVFYAISIALLVFNVRLEGVVVYMLVFMAVFSAFSLLMYIPVFFKLLNTKESI